MCCPWCLPTALSSDRQCSEVGGTRGGNSALAGSTHSNNQHSRAAAAYSMLTRNIAEPWGTGTQQPGSLETQGSIKKGLLSRQPDSPLSDAEGFISTAIPSHVAAAAAADSHSSEVTPHSGLSGSTPVYDAQLAKSSFEQLCHDGSAWSWRNWRVKVWRYTLMMTKQIYLVWLAILSVPTNHLMVSDMCTGCFTRCNTKRHATPPSHQPVSNTTSR